MILAPIKVVMKSKKKSARVRENISKSPFVVKKKVLINDFRSDIIQNKKIRLEKSIDIIKKPLPKTYEGYLKKKSIEDKEKNIYYEPPIKSIVLPNYMITPEYLNSIRKISDSEKKELSILSFKKKINNSLPPVPKLPIKICEKVLKSNRKVVLSKTPVPWEKSSIVPSIDYFSDSEDSISNSYLN